MAAPRVAGALVVCWVTCAPLASAALAAKPPLAVADARATAREAAVVHGGAGEQTPVVGQLAKGDVVTVDIELNGSAGHWCKVIEQGQTAALGYVACSSLERRPGPRWTRVSTAAPSGAPSGTAPSASAPSPRAKPAADPAKRPYSDVNVLFYSAPWCPHSTRARRFLHSLGVSVTEYDIDKDPEKKAELVAKVGRVAVPLIDVEGIQISGFGEDSVRNAVEKRRAAQ